MDMLYIKECADSLEVVAARFSSYVTVACKASVYDGNAESLALR